MKSVTMFVVLLAVFSVSLTISGCGGGGGNGGGGGSGTGGGNTIGPHADATVTPPTYNGLVSGQIGFYIKLSQNVTWGDNNVTIREGKTGGTLLNVSPTDTTGYICYQAPTTPGNYHIDVKLPLNKSSDFTIPITVSAGMLPHYRIQVLSSSSKFSALLNLNDQGTVVGWQSTTQNDGPYPWDASRWVNGVQSTFITWDVGIDQAEAQAINNKGTVIGQRRSGSYTYLAFVWSNGVLSYIPLPTGSTNTYAVDINSTGDIAGYTDDGTNWTNTHQPAHHADATSQLFLWKNGAIQILGQGYPIAMNDSDQIAGVLGGQNVLISSGLPTNLGMLIPTGINNRGVVCGNFVDDSNQPHSGLWQNGQLVDLGAGNVVNGDTPLAGGIDDSGTVVGGHLVWFKGGWYYPSDLVSGLTGTCSLAKISRGGVILASSSALGEFLLIPS